MGLWTRIKPWRSNCQSIFGVTLAYIRGYSSLYSGLPSAYIRGYRFLNFISGFFVNASDWEIVKCKDNRWLNPLIAGFILQSVFIMPASENIEICESV